MGANRFWGQTWHRWDAEKRGAPAGWLGDPSTGGAGWGSEGGTERFNQLIKKRRPSGRVGLCEGGAVAVAAAARRPRSGRAASGAGPSSLQTVGL